MAFLLNFCILQQILSSGTVFETYRVGVAVEARAGDTGPGAGNSIALSDERLRRGLEDLERKVRFLFFSSLSQ